MDEPGRWDSKFKETTVSVQRRKAQGRGYTPSPRHTKLVTQSNILWSRTLKLADGNYSPTEREASASRDGLLKFQPYIEGETVIAITDHVALI